MYINSFTGSVESYSSISFPLFNQVGFPIIPNAQAKPLQGPAADKVYLSVGLLPASTNWTVNIGLPFAQRFLLVFNPAANEIGIAETPSTYVTFNPLI